MGRWPLIATRTRHQKFIAVDLHKRGRIIQWESVSKSGGEIMEIYEILVTDAVHRFLQFRGNKFPARQPRRFTT